MKAVYKLNIDCGRQGTLEGIFIAEKEDVKILIETGIEVYFGEVLGKHSEVCGSLEDHDIEHISDDENVVSLVNKYGLENGHNPFHYPSINFDPEKFGIPEQDISDDDIDDLCIEDIIHLIRKYKS